MLRLYRAMSAAPHALTTAGAVMAVTAAVARLLLGTGGAGDAGGAAVAAMGGNTPTPSS